MKISDKGRTVKDMLSAICAEIRNYFTYEQDKHIGDFAIVDGKIAPSINIPTDYIRIVGSHLNDGVHKISDNDLKDEGSFHGAIWVMSPPQSFLDLAEEIAAWMDTNGKPDSQAMSPYQSESFGGYSYQKAGGSSSTGSTTGANWAAAYETRLKAYRRIRV